MLLDFNHSIDTFLIILVVITFANIWVDEIRDSILVNVFNSNNKLATLIHYLIIHKPLNCSNCLVFWATVIIFAITLNPYYLTGYLINRLINKLL